MKYYLIAGESSGDSYGAALMQELIKCDPQAEFRFWGGDKMKAISEDQEMSIDKTAIMGLWEVVKNIQVIRGFFKQIKNNITSFSPDIIICIDYPGFNLRVTKWAKKNGFRTAYYISPQIWAWRSYRSKIIKAYVDLFFIVLPFERKIYNALGISYHYFGHPIIELIKPSQIKSISKDVSTIGIFPGSRKQEIEKHLPIIAALSKELPHINFVISKVTHLDLKNYIKHFDEAFTNVRVTENFDDVIDCSDIAIASSGTVTLQLALLNLPHIVIYKTSAINYSIAKRLISLKYISLPNLIADESIVCELIQNELTANKLAMEINKLLDLKSRELMCQKFKYLRSLLEEDQTSKKIAQTITEFLELKSTI